MKVDLISKSGKRLQLHGAEIAIKPNGYDPVQLRAELDEGESPVEIIITQGKERKSFPIRKLTIESREKILVRAHVRKYKSGSVRVEAHYMKKRLPKPKAKGVRHG